MMLNELCRELKNWFTRGLPKYTGKITIDQDGNMTCLNTYHVITKVQPKDGQYYRIEGSVFNNGIHKYPSDDLIEESFDGTVWLMAIPAEILTLAEDIERWSAKYANVDSPAMSPFNREAFGGYEYEKGSSFGDGASATAGGSWQSVFASRLKNWRKIR